MLLLRLFSLCLALFLLFPLALLLLYQLHLRLVLLASSRVGHHEGLGSLGAALSLLLGGPSVQDGLLVQDPVVLAIVLQLKLAEECLEKVAEVLVVRLLLEGQVSRIVHVLLKRQWASFTKLLDRCVRLFL